MWFKNLQIYRLPAPWPITAEDLEAQLAKHQFQPCGSQDAQTRGWLPPYGKEGLVRAVAGQFLICLGLENKLLPSSVVNQFAKDRAAEIEDKEGYRPGKKMMREIKEQVITELLPRAFTRRVATYIWIDPVDGWLAIDASSTSRADEILEHLIKAIDNLPLKLLKTQVSPVSAMADWLAGNEAPPGFSIDRDCELKAMVEEKSTVRYVRHPLDSEEVRNHLISGKLPTRLSLTFDDRISFALTEKLEIKKLAFLDIIKEQLEGVEGAEEQFNADFALMTAELRRFLPEMAAALGGEMEG